MPDEIQELDEVETPEGRGIAVGFLPQFGQIEVRYPSRGRLLRVWPSGEVTKAEGQPKEQKILTVEAPVEIATPEAASEYARMREQGINPTVPAEVFGEELPPPPPQQSTLARQVASGKSKPRMSKQEALAKARKAREAKARSEK